jgi:xanthine dehydrogenase accessory factor
MRSDLLDLASRLAARGERFALVTVVRREPPSSARVGDTALVTANGEVHGWVGGGCTRSTLLRESLRAIADGEPRLLSLSVDPAAERRPGLTALPMTCKSGGTVDLYVEAVLPAPRVVVFGATPIARAMVRLGCAMGYRVDLHAPEADVADFPEATRVSGELAPEVAPLESYVLVATMDESDLEAIEAAVPLKPAYFGVIASRKRFGELLDALHARGVPHELTEGIVAPAGLDIGARTPEEIALSVMAQIVECRRKARPVPKTANASAGASEPREAIDPVCGMTVTVDGARQSAEVDGRRYYFCCAGCRTKFLADPARYRSRDTQAHST